MGGKFLRCIGLAQAQSRIGMMNPVYNFMLARGAGACFRLVHLHGVQEARGNSPGYLSSQQQALSLVASHAPARGGVFGERRQCIASSHELAGLSSHYLPCLPLHRAGSPQRLRGSYGLDVFRWAFRFDG